MKRMLVWITVAAVLLALVSGVALAAGKWGTYQGYSIVRVMVDGKEVKGDVPAFLMTGDRTMVPVRFVSEALGATVTWDGANETAVITTNPAAGSLIMAGLTGELKTSSDGKYKLPGEISDTINKRQTDKAYLYVKAWDDGKSHTWTVTWRNSQGVVYKTGEVTPQPLPKDDFDARIYLTDDFALTAPLTRGQSTIPSDGNFLVTVERDGRTYVRLPLKITR